MNRFRLSPATALAACCLIVGSLAPFSGRAAADVAPSLKSSENLTPDNVTAINAQVMRAVNQLKSGLPDDISFGREWLIKELRTPGASVAYKNVLARILLPAAEDLLKSPNIQVRVNAVMVVAWVPSVDAAATLAPGVGDKSEGVRFAACRAMRKIIEPAGGEHRNLGAEQENALLVILHNAATKESNDLVFGEMVDLLSVIGTPASQNALLSVLDDRLPGYADPSEKSFKIPAGGISTLYRKLLQSGEKGAVMMHVMATAFRYERLAAQQLAVLPKDAFKKASGDRRDMVIAGDKLLRAQYKAMGGTGTLPPDIQGQASLDHWKDVQGMVNQWGDLLKVAPFAGFPWSLKN